MMLITKEIAKKLPALYTNDSKPAEEVKVPLKLFNPCGSQSWFITEMDPESGLMFGYVTGMDYDELGYTDFNELKAVRLRFGMKIERDRYWDGNNTLAQVMNGEKS